MGTVLRVTSGPYEGQEFLLKRNTTCIVGRSSRVSFSLPHDPSLSREHFQIENFPPACHLVDLGSTNGTKVNGLRVERVLIREGDIISAGDSSFSVYFAASEFNGSLRGTCAGCGGPVGAEQPRYPASMRKTAAAVGVMAVPSPTTSVLLCATCEERRRQFPETDPDYLIEELIGEGG